MKLIHYINHFMVSNIISRLKKHKLLIASSLPSILIWTCFMVIEGNNLVLDSDLFMPLWPPNQNLLFFISPWYTADFGFPTSSPIIYLLAFLISSITNNLAVTQHAIQLAPLIISFFTSWLFLGKISYRKHFLPLFSNFYVFNAVSLNQFVGATGLMYIYAFTPLILYYMIRLLRNDGSAFKNVTGIIFASYFATISSSETIMHIALTSVPIIMAFIFDVVHQRWILRRHLTFIIGIFASFFFYLLFQLAAYLPWMEATLGIKTVQSSGLLQIANVFLSKNFYLQFGGRADLSIFPFFYSPLSSIVYVYKPAPILLALSIGIIIIYVFSIYFPERNFMALPSIIFLALSNGYIELIIYSPNTAFLVFTSLKPLTLPLVAVPIIQEWWYVLVPWEIVSAYLGTISIYDFVSRKRKIAIRDSHVKNVQGLSRIRRYVYNMRSGTLQLLPVVLVILVIMSTLNYQMPQDLNANSPSAPLVSGYWWGNIIYPKHVPSYILSLENKLEVGQLRSPFRILFFPSSPGVVNVWTYSNPYSISFPSSSQYINSTIQLFLGYINDNNSEMAAYELSSLGIKYVVVLWHFNENKSIPYMISAAAGGGLIGDPHIMYRTLAYGADFSLLSNDSDYALFQNNIFSFFRLYGAAFYLPPVSTVGLNLSTQVSNYPGNNTRYASSMGYNLLGYLPSSNGQPSWSSMQGFNMSVANNSGYYSVEVNHFNTKNGSFGVTWYSDVIPVLPGQVYNFRYVLNSSRNSSGLVYVGWNNRTMNIDDDTGDMNLPLVAVDGATSSQHIYNVTIPNDTYFIIPVLVFYRFNGTVNITDISLELTGNNALAIGSSQYEFIKRQFDSNILSASLRDIYPFSHMALLTSFKTPENTSVIPMYSAELAVNSRLSPDNIDVIFPQYGFIPIFGILDYNGNGVSFHSNGQLEYEMKARNGSYTAVIEMYGHGLSYTSISNTGEFFSNPVASHPYLLNFSVTNGSFVFTIQNFVGSLTVSSIIILNRSSQAELGRLFSAASHATIKVDGFHTSYFEIKVQTRYPVILEADQNYAGPWRAWSLVSFGKQTPIESISLNGWELGFIVNTSGNLTVYVSYNPGLMFYVLKYVNISAFFGLPLLLFGTYILPFKRRQKNGMD